ncbi:MAG: hypothetical protein ACR2QV_05340 [Gammaproteobacteria bacterium]
MTTRDTNTESPIPFRHWWGLVGCAALMGVIFMFAPYSADVDFEPDRGNWWYYWQLRDANAWTRIAAWVPYSLHQVSIWYLIAQAQRARPKYVFGLHRHNVIALSVNVFFVLVHIAQTKLTYDGLAQDVHEATSMGSVTLMLFLILLMENKRRGLFFGYGAKPLYGVGDAVRRYHGYYFSWAIIYTFWYHPVEMTSGHLAGFAYMMLLLLQCSLFFTRFHTNRWWTVSLEFLFVVHGSMVAYFIMNQPGHAPWAYFLFGGISTFLIIQMHGLGLSTKAKLAIAAPLVLGMIAFYIWIGAPGEILGIPNLTFIMYAGTLAVGLVVWILMGVAKLVSGQQNQASGSGA